jgi:virulence factor
MKKLKILAVGLGDIAQKAYLPVLSCRPDVELVLCTRNTEVLARLAAKYRVKQHFSDFSQALECRPDAVMVHSSTDSHFAIINRCLELHLPVFVDKPISNRLAEVESLIQKAREKNRLFMVGFNRRYAPAYQQIFARKIRAFRYTKNRHNLPGIARTFVYDDFIHVLDCGLFFSKSRPERVAVFHNYYGDDLACVDVRWQHYDTLVDLSMDRMAGRTSERVVVVAENTHWESNNFNPGEEVSDLRVSSEPIDHWQDTLTARGFTAMVDDFVNRLATGCCSLSLTESYLATHRLCEKIVEQLEMPQKDKTEPTLLC